MKHPHSLQLVSPMWLYSFPEYLQEVAATDSTMSQDPSSTHSIIKLYLFLRTFYTTVNIILLKVGISLDSGKVTQGQNI